MGPWGLAGYELLRAVSDVVLGAKGGDGHISLADFGMGYSAHNVHAGDGTGFARGVSSLKEVLLI